MPVSLQGRGHPPALLFLGTLLCVLGSSQAWAKPAALPPHRLAPSSPETGRVSFRMDNLSANLKGRTLNGLGNVVVRQDAWLLCCDALEATADAAGAWQHMRCVGHVRAYHAGRRVWAETAHFEPERQTLTLTGRPRITQGVSHIEGQRIVLHTGSHEAQIVGPKGTVAQADAQEPSPAAAASGPEFFLTEPLPDQCPWPWQAAPL